MGDRGLVKECLCAVYFTFPDKSVVRCVCTANKDIVECYGIIWHPEYLYDVEVLKPIPEYMFALPAKVFRLTEDLDSREPLDQFINDFIKNSWPY